MPEKEEEGTSKALEVIPLFFFDLMARVVPGLFVLFGVNLICGWKPLIEIVEQSVAEKVLDSAFTLLAIALLAGYITGHLMSPFVKVLDNWYKNAGKPFWDRWRPPTSVSQKEQDTDKQLDYAEMYDQLRLLCPGVTNITMRIRAEYIMYGGFCVALLVQFFVFISIGVERISAVGLASLLSRFHLADCVRGGSKAAILLAGAVLMFLRNQETIGTFNRTVKHFYDAATKAGRIQEHPAESIKVNS